MAIKKTPLTQEKTGKAQPHPKIIHNNGKASPPTVQCKPDNKTRERQHKIAKVQANLICKHGCKNPKQDISKPNHNCIFLKKENTLALFQKYKSALTLENLLMYFIT